MSDLEGIVVDLDRGCNWCGNTGLIVTGPANGSHTAILFCQHCQRNGGWLEKEAVAFLTDFIKTWGKPNEPVIYRKPFVSSPARKRKG